MSDITIPVFIVGGGGAGLTASMLLSSYGVDSLLVNGPTAVSHGDLSARVRIHEQP